MHVVEYNAQKPDVSLRSVEALSSAPTPSERVMLRRQAQEAAGERAAAEKLIAVEAAARPAGKKAKKGLHKKSGEWHRGRCEMVDESSRG